MENKFAWNIIKEGIFILIAALLLVLAVYPVYEYISLSYIQFFAISIWIIVEYFRVVVNERNVTWIRPFALKVLFGFGNIVLFLFVMDSFSILVGQFEDYNFTGIGVKIRDILPGLSVSKYSYLRSMTFFTGIAAMILIILFQFRLVYSIFKYRELPGLHRT